MFVFFRSACLSGGFYVAAQQMQKPRVAMKKLHWEMVKGNQVPYLSLLATRCVNFTSFSTHLYSNKHKKVNNTIWKELNDTDVELDIDVSTFVVEHIVFQ